MSAPSASTSIAPGKCVVCGKETWMRCSACSKAGLDWMCFCSIEHQKLLWFMHKRICGERSNPFRFPGLYKAELEESIRLGEQPTDGGSPESWLEIFCNAYKLNGPVECRQERYKACLEMFWLETRPDVPQSFETTTSMIGYRSLAYAWRAKNAKAICETRESLVESHARICLRYPFDFYAYLVGIMREDELQRPEYADWLSDFQHRQLHYIAMLILDMQRNGDHRDLERYLVYTFDEFRKFLLDEVAKVSPQTIVAIGNVLAKPGGAKVEETS